ncbi:MAG: hypothetical protein CFE40_06495 [Burkholderiales bacterium PBB1]|nr:MAG: hypothetical protein CFE40_06495 [Burkholderiales bacterium PBB1]
MVPGRGAVPTEQGLVPSDDAVDPGVMEMVQLLLAVSVLPQLLELVVPAGQVGKDTATLIAVSLPVLVTVIERAAPDEGVPPIPYSVSPVTLRAILLTLMASVVCGSGGGEEGGELEEPPQPVVNTIQAPMSAAEARFFVVIHRPRWLIDRAGLLRILVRVWACGPRQFRA